MIENLWGLIYFVFWIQGVEPPETLLLQGDTRMLNPLWLLQFYSLYKVIHGCW